MVKKGTGKSSGKGYSLALFSLVLGLIGFIIPLGGIAALVLGIVALRGDRTEKSKRWMAWAGVLLGAIKIVLVIIILFIMGLSG